MPGRPMSSRSSLRRCLPFGSFHPAYTQREFDVLADSHVPEEGVVLEDEAHFPFPCRYLGDVATEQRDAPMVDFSQAGNRAEQGALAAAAGPKENKELALGYGKRYVVDDRVALVLLGDLIKGDGHGLERIPARRSARQL